MEPNDVATHPFCHGRRPWGMGEGDGPLQNLRWGTAHAFVPPIFGEVVLLEACESS